MWGFRFSCKGFWSWISTSMSRGLEPGGVESWCLEPGGLESRTTDFGSG